MNSVKKNFLYQAAYEMLVILMPIITSPYVSRVLGAYNLGIHSYTYTMANYFVLFAALGIKNYGNREISRVRDDKKKLNTTYSGILFLHFFVSAIVLFAYIVYVLFIVSDELRLYALIQGLYVVTAFFDISWLFFGLEEFKITVARNSVIKTLSVVCIFTFVRDTNDLWKYVFILAAANMIGQGYLWLYAGKYASLVKVSKQEIMRHFPQLLILFIPAVAISIYNYMDKIMLGGMSGNEQLGFYENAEKIIFVASSVIGSIGTVMLPRMSNITAKGDIKTRNRYIMDSMKFVSCLSFAIAFGIAGISDVFSIVFWGNDFSACGPLLVLLAIILPIKGFANVLRTEYLIPSKMDKVYMISGCIGAAVNLVFNFVFIPKYRAAGAAIGTIFAETAVCIVQACCCFKELAIRQYVKKSLIYVVFGLIMFGIVYGEGMILGISLLTMIIQIVSGIIIYSLLMLIYVLITKDEPYYKYLMRGISMIRRKR